jgi:hypothetical protein
VARDHILATQAMPSELEWGALAGILFPHFLNLESCSMGIPSHGGSIGFDIGSIFPAPSLRNKR